MCQQVEANGLMPMDATGLVQLTAHSPPTTPIERRVREPFLRNTRDSRLAVCLGN